MLIHDLQHLTQTHYLELAYEQSLREADTIIHEEEARRLQLRILLLEDNNDELNEQLTLEDDKMEELERECVELRMRLEQAEIDVRKGENDLRIQTREISNLRVCETCTRSYLCLAD
jgi:chromosome segregation ATPase